MRAAKLKRTKETRASRALVPAYADVVAARDALLRAAVTARQVRGGAGWEGRAPLPTCPPASAVTPR
jgi:hypothetical protein